MRRLLYGFLVGTLLSAMHAPRGLDLLQVPAVDAGTAYALRAGALFVLGLLAVASPRTMRAARLPGRAIQHEQVARAAMRGEKTVRFRVATGLREAGFFSSKKIQAASGLVVPRAPAGARPEVVRP